MYIWASGKNEMHGSVDIQVMLVMMEEITRLKVKLLHIQNPESICHAPRTDPKSEPS